MTKYAFKTGSLEADNGCKATLHEVALTFDQKLESIVGQNKVVVALGDGELKITGIAKRIEVHEGELPASGQIYFHTTTSNFGVSRQVTIKLNHCLIVGNGFEAKPDESGNVFTLSMEE